MTVNSNFLLRQIADTWVVLPMSEKDISFNGIMTLNETGVLLWNVLEKGADVPAMVETLMAEYDVSREQAQADVERFLQKLRGTGCLVEA